MRLKNSVSHFQASAGLRHTDESLSSRKKPGIFQKNISNMGYYRLCHVNLKKYQNIRTLHDSCEKNVEYKGNNHFAYSKSPGKCLQRNQNMENSKDEMRLCAVENHENTTKDLRRHCYFV